MGEKSIFSVMAGADSILSLSRRTKPANEVYVTGTFDNWAKTEKLDPVGTGFEKTVTLPDSSAKILYKVSPAV